MCRHFAGCHRLAVIGVASHCCGDIISLRHDRSLLTGVVNNDSSVIFQRNWIKMAVESRVTQEEIKKEPEKPVDREKVSFSLLLFASCAKNRVQTTRLAC